MSNITQINQTKFAFIYEKLLGDFTKQPVKVTINNIINEWPSIFPPTEAMLSSGTKVYMVSEVIHFFGPPAGINPKDLKGDSTYKGQFMQNIVSATKNLRLWYEGVPRGTRKHGLDRPIADILKGLGKITLLWTFPIASQYIFITNYVCELVGYSFVITVENIQNRDKDIYDSKEWLEELSKSEFWLDSGRRAFAQTISAWFVMGSIIKPVEHYLGHILSDITPISLQTTVNRDWALKDLAITNMIEHHSGYIAPVINYLGETIRYIPYLGNYLTELKIPEIIWLPSVMNYMVNVVTGMVMVPVVRSATYKINNNIKVIVEQNDLLSCMKISDVFELAKASNKTITYNYDAYKIGKNATKNTFICDLGKGKQIGFIKTTSNDQKQDCTNELIVHYPKENNALGQITESFSNCFKDPAYCLSNMMNNAITSTQSVVNYGKDIGNNIASSYLYTCLLSVLTIELANHVWNNLFTGEDFYRE